MTIDRWLQRARLRIRSIAFGHRADRELDEELLFHIDRQTEANIAAGMTPSAARTTALRAMGGVEQRKEECRDTRRVSWLIDAMRDGRHAVRLVARGPVFAVAAVLSLGAGIAANVSMFSVVDALLLKKLPVPEPDGLVSFTIMTEPPYRRDDVPYFMFDRLRAGATAFTAIAGSVVIERANLTVDAARDGLSTDLTRVGMVTGDYFPVLGVEASLGRALGPADDTDRPIAVVSHPFWRTRLNGDANLASHTVHLNGTVYDIVGVTPPGFGGELVGAPIDLWVPFTLAPGVVPETPTWPHGFTLRMIARVTPGISTAQATASTLPLLRQAYRDNAARYHVRVSDADLAAIELQLDDMSRGISPQRRAIRPSLLTLMAFVGLLLVVGCANVANLLLARSSSRQRELAVRLAVGAGRGRIARQLLAESTIIAALGGVVGLALGLWSIRLLSVLLASAPASSTGQSTGIVLDLGIDPRVLLFSTLLCVAAAALSGLAPAMHAHRITPASVLRANRTLGPGRHGGPSSLLLIGQVAVSLVLLIGAGLFIRSLDNLRSRDLGLERENQLLIWTAPGQTGRRDDAMVDLWHEVQARLSDIPGVVAAGASNQAVLNGGTPGPGVAVVGMIIPGEPPIKTDRIGGRSFVTPGFFAAAGIRVIAGREFTERDAGHAAHVAMLNATMARFYFGSEAAAIGRRVQFPGEVKALHEIVGVVADHVRTTPRDALDYFSTFHPYRHSQAINRGQASRLRFMLVAVKVAGDPFAMAQAIRRELRDIDPLLPVLNIKTTEQQLDGLLAQDRMVATLSAVLGAVAVLLSSLGVFSLLSYRVARRANEIGVRLALGATRTRVRRVILAEGGRLVGLGMVAGVIASMALARLIGARLYGISATDPWTIGGALLLLSIVAWVAAFVPARQASVVDPATALRAD